MLTHVSEAHGWDLAAVAVIGAARVDGRAGRHRMREKRPADDDAEEAQPRGGGFFATSGHCARPGNGLMARKDLASDRTRRGARWTGLDLGRHGT